MIHEYNTAVCHITSWGYWSKGSLHLAARQRLRQAGVTINLQWISTLQVKVFSQNCFVVVWFMTALSFDIAIDVSIHVKCLNHDVTRIGYIAKWWAFIIHLLTNRMLKVQHDWVLSSYVLSRNFWCGLCGGCGIVQRTKRSVIRVDWLQINSCHGVHLNYAAAVNWYRRWYKPCSAIVYNMDFFNLGTDIIFCQVFSLPSAVEECN